MICSRHGSVIGVREKCKSSEFDEFLAERGGVYERGSVCGCIGLANILEKSVV